MKTGVILLHGVNGSGQGMARAVRALATQGVVTFAPDAPERADHGAEGHYHWFSVIGISNDNRAARIRGAREGLDRLIDDFVARESLDRLVGFGFSQGAIMALDALARGKLAEVVALAGRLAFDGALTPRHGARALLIGGDLDRIVPAALSVEAAKVLQEAGVATKLIVQPGVEHRMTDLALQEAQAFLA